MQEDTVYAHEANDPFLFVPLSVLAASLFAEIILNQKLRGTNFFRTIFYLPALVPSVALAVMWVWILNPQYGLINQGLAAIGIKGPGWLLETKWAIPSLILILIGVWGSFGGTQMLIFLAALQGVPPDLYEVADLDGAGAWQKLRHVTVPMISPAILFNLIMGIIGSFQSFILAYLVAGGTGDMVGGPNWATYFIGLHIYQKAFADYEMGYASALAWVLFFIILLMVLINFKLSGRWVFMAAEGN